MKLAEALAERSDCLKRLDGMTERLAGSVRVQEGERPSEDPAQLLAEADQIHARLLELICAINRTNAQTSFAPSRTLTDAIAERDVLMKRREFLSGIAGAARNRWDRYSKSEVRFVTTVAVGELQTEVDQLARRYRELDLRIQELNWQTELI